MSDHVIFFDTTLRDGEQSPGISLTADEKVQIARQLVLLGIDVIEAGFPVASQGDFLAVQRIAREVDGAVICALARAQAGDIDRAWEAVRDAARPRLHVFLATSELHIEKKLESSHEEVLEQIRASVSHAASLCDDVEFSPEDGSRTDLDFLEQTVKVALECGATTINIPDTVGFATPESYALQLEQLIERVPELKEVVLSVHCHDDLGLATANAWAGLRAGARQVEGTINGIGERAGNTSLEELCMLLRTHPEAGLRSGLDVSQLPRTSRLVSRLTGYQVPPNKAVVGANAFAHEAGIHQDGVLKDRSTYEILDPEELGLVSNALVLGKHSGRHALREALENAGYRVSGDQLNRIFKEFKDLCDRKKHVSIADLEAIADQQSVDSSKYLLISHSVTSSSDSASSATVTLQDKEGKSCQGEGQGDGPVDALLGAVGKATGREVQLLEYRVEALTADSDALGEVMVRVKCEGQVLSGRAAGTDILQATALAYLRALN